MQFVSRVTATAALSEHKRERAQQITDRVFDAMTRMNVSEGMVRDFSSPDDWRHRTTQHIEADLAYLEIHRPAILAALSDYLIDTTLRTREIDWLFLNLLTYAEYLATVSEVRKSLQGVDEYIKFLHPPKSDHAASVAAFASRPWRAFIALSGTATCFFVNPAVAAGVGAIAFYWHVKQKKAINKVDAVLSAMLRTYESFNTVDLSWAHVSRSLEDSRKAGAIWDASLYRLADIRQGAA